MAMDQMYTDCLRELEQVTQQRDQLREALDQAVTSMQDSGYSNKSVAVRACREALKQTENTNGRD